jgi:proton-coupled amino acid transporter
MLTFFGLLCMLSYGEELKTPLIMDNLPQNVVIYAFKCIFCINLIITYPLMINVSNEIIESRLFDRLRISETKRYFYCNFLRTLMVALTIVIAILANEKLNKFLSLLGAIACIPIAYILPALFHYRICARNAREKLKDQCLIVFSVIMALFSAF